MKITSETDIPTLEQVYTLHSRVFAPVIVRLRRRDLVKGGPSLITKVPEIFIWKLLRRGRLIAALYMYLLARKSRRYLR